MKFYRLFPLIGALSICLSPPQTRALSVPWQASSRQVDPLIEVGNVVQWLIDLIPMLIEGINGLVHDKSERADFVKNVINQTTLLIASSDQLIGYNALVVDENHHYVAQFTDVVAEFKIHYPGELFGINAQTYHLYVFRGGRFELNGDGGFENWAYTGGQVVGPGIVEWPDNKKTNVV